MAHKLNQLQFVVLLCAFSRAQGAFLCLPFVALIDLSDLLLAAAERVVRSESAESLL